MKSIVAIIISLSIVSMANAGGHTVHKKPTTHKKATAQKQAQCQKQTQAQKQSQSAKASATASSAAEVSNYSPSEASATGGSSSAATGPVSVDARSSERISFAPINSAAVKIGETSKPVPQVFTAWQAEDDQFDGRRTNSFIVGGAFPITWGTGINGALATESKRLEDRNYQQRVEFQARMETICMQLHKESMDTGTAFSKELWDQCGAYEHFNNSRTNDNMGRHAGEMDPRQYSPHHIEYHND
jgi:hypothetical protein